MDTLSTTTPYLCAQNAAAIAFYKTAFGEVETMHLDDPDGLFARAVSAGATVDRPMADQFDGEFRNGKLVDPYGHRWMLLTRLRPAAEASL
jgi:uncharacterized glyoxalase superfamily protein PhnB